MQNFSNSVYEKGEYIILRTKTGYVVYNTTKPFLMGHTHHSSLNTCKEMIDYAILGNVPNTSNLYLLGSLIRISNNQDYVNLLYDKRVNKYHSRSKRNKKYYNQPMKYKKSKGGI